MNELSSIYYESPVGPLKISGTDAYISEIAFEDRSKTPDIISEDPPASLLTCVEQLIEYFNGQRKTFDLILNQPGTPFQHSVWSELMLIPYAKTISYLELARRTGDTKATRAVAAANGRNNLAIVVPCHRVIGSNSDLVGYGGGLWRKKFLLELETKIVYGVQTLF
jgi:methylated-DNA-[protein]-cysteine S-methyltransferase